MSQPVVTSLPAGKGAFVICSLFLVLVLLFTLEFLDFWNSGMSNFILFYFDEDDAFH